MAIAGCTPCLSSRAGVGHGGGPWERQVGTIEVSGDVRSGRGLMAHCSQVVDPARCMLTACGSTLEREKCLPQVCSWKHCLGRNKTWLCRGDLRRGSGGLVLFWCTE